jgi:hypothetical protein
MADSREMSKVTKIVELNGKKVLVAEVPPDTPEGTYQVKAIAVHPHGAPSDDTNCVVDNTCHNQCAGRKNRILPVRTID